MKKIVILVVLSLLLLVPLVQSYGEIVESVVDSEATDTDRVYGKHTICRVNNSNYYLSVRDDATWDNVLETWEINPDNGTVNLVDQVSKSAVSYAGSVCHRPNSDIYLTVYGDKPYIVSYSVSDQTGDIINSNIDSLDTGSVDREDYTLIRHVTGDMFVSLGVPSSENCVYLRTFNCTKEGVLTDYGSEVKITSMMRSYTHDMIVVDSDTILIGIHEMDGAGIDIRTYNISSLGAFTLYGNFSLDATGQDVSIVRATENSDDNLYLFTTEGQADDVRVYSRRVQNNGRIDAQLDVRSYGGSILELGAMERISLGHYVVVYENNVGVSTALTFNVTTSNGTIYNNHDTYDFGGNYTYNYDILHCNSSYYMIWSGYGVHILDINTPLATVSNVYPANGASDIPDYPHCRVTVNHPKGLTMNITFLDNSTGSWIIQSTNSTVTNGTYAFNYTNANSYNTRYFWRVYIDDGFTNQSFTYYYDSAGFNFGIISFYGTDAGDHIHLTWIVPTDADWAVLSYLGSEIANETIAYTYDHYVTMTATYYYTLEIWNSTYNGYNLSTISVAFTFPGQVGDLGVPDNSWSYIIIGIIVLLGFLLPNIVAYNQRGHVKHPPFIINVFTGTFTIAGLVLFNILPLATLLVISFVAIIYIIYKARSM